MPAYRTTMSIELHGVHAEYPSEAIERVQQVIQSAIECEIGLPITFYSEAAEDEENA